MIIEMRYPRDDRNKNFDGNVHEIEPLRLKRMNKNGVDIYLLVYNDKTLKKKNMVTLLGKTLENEFYKIPLANYSNFNFSKIQFQILGLGEDVPLQVLKDGIATMNSIYSIDDVLNGETKKITSLAAGISDGSIVPPTPPVATATLPPTPPTPPTPPVATVPPTPPTPPTPPKNELETQPWIESHEKTIVVFYNRLNKKLYYDPICVNEVPESEIHLHTFEKKYCEEHTIATISGFSSRLSKSMEMDSVDDYTLHVHSVVREVPQKDDYLFNVETLVDELVSKIEELSELNETAKILRINKTVRAIIKKVAVFSKLVEDTKEIIDRREQIFRYFEKLLGCKSLYELEEVQKKHRPKS